MPEQPTEHPDATLQALATGAGAGPAAAPTASAAFTASAASAAGPGAGSLGPVVPLASGIGLVLIGVAIGWMLRRPH
jgi:hypothetical protein